MIPHACSCPCDGTGFVLLDTEDGVTDVACAGCPECGKCAGVDEYGDGCLTESQRTSPRGL